MPGVFLSYSRGDRALAHQIIHDLRALGVEVWWDEDMPGVDWQEELERQISHLAGVVVVWTPHSAASKNVKDEARLGLSTDKLVNVLLGSAQPPFPFDRVNGLPLDGWTGREPHKGWTRLVQTVEAMLVRAGGAQPGEISEALARREREVRLKQQAVARAQAAFQDAQNRESDAADATKATRAALERAEEQHQRVVEMRPAAAILNGARMEVDTARAASEQADQALKAAKAKLSEASRAMSRANTALEKLFTDSAMSTERTPSYIPAPQVETISPPPPPPIITPPPAPPPPETLLDRLKRLAKKPINLAIAGGVVVVVAVGIGAALKLHPVHRGPLSPAAAAAVAALDQSGDNDMNSKDYADALSLYQKAADQGDAHAQHYLGWIYQNGFGVTQDYTKAMTWYRLAADQNYADSDANIGWMYENGLGVAIDFPEAMKWYRLAAAQGNALAQNEIGVLYANGSGVPKDYVEAIKWFRFAAAQSWPAAENWLGYVYANGYGVDQNLVTAREWYTLGAQGGDEGSKTWLAQNPQQ
jgi:TPR repeat protein